MFGCSHPNQVNPSWVTQHLIQEKEDKEKISKEWNTFIARHKKCSTSERLKEASEEKILEKHPKDNALEEVLQRSLTEKSYRCHTEVFEQDKGKDSR